MSERLISAAQEINTLHNELCSLGKLSLEKAIRIGELLSQTKAGLKHGRWLPWIEEHLEFDQKTVWRYMQVFLHREKLGIVPNLTNAYALLARKSESEAKAVIQAEKRKKFLEAPPAANEVDKDQSPEAISLPPLPTNSQTLDTFSKSVFTECGDYDDEAADEVIEILNRELRPILVRVADLIDRQPEHCRHSVLELLTDAWAGGLSELNLVCDERGKTTAPIAGLSRNAKRGELKVGPTVGILESQLESGVSPPVLRL